MVTHPRVMENTVRKTDDRRKRKRAEKAERKAAEESTQEQDVKRLKNLKGQEIQTRSGCMLTESSCNVECQPADCLPTRGISVIATIPRQMAKLARAVHCLIT